MQSCTFIHFSIISKAGWAFSPIKVFVYKRTAQAISNVQINLYSILKYSPQVPSRVMTRCTYKASWLMIMSSELYLDYLFVHFNCKSLTRGALLFFHEIFECTAHYNHYDSSLLTSTTSTIGTIAVHPAQLQPFRLKCVLVKIFNRSEQLTHGNFRAEAS